MQNLLSAIPFVHAGTIVHILHTSPYPIAKILN